MFVYKRGTYICHAYIRSKADMEQMAARSEYSLTRSQQESLGSAMALTPSMSMRPQSP